MTEKYNIYELKEEIMGCQGILDDINTIIWSLDENKENVDKEDIIIILQGLEALYEIKFSRLWKTLFKIEQE